MLQVEKRWHVKVVLHRCYQSKMPQTLDEKGVKLSEDIVTDKGEFLKISYEAKVDGKDYSVTGDPSTDWVSYQRVNATTLKSNSELSRLSQAFDSFFQFPDWTTIER